MERGIYFDGWYKNNHCYHPSLPYRSMQMIEDLERYKGTMLVWSALGGGSISLPFLEHEAFGEVDPRLRFYGFMNDSEFIEECNKRGIKVFAIVFEVQGWQFPAILNEDGTAFKALNVLRDENAEHDWYGLREFTSGKHDKVFGKSLKDYFPEGLYNSDGVEVTNIFEECAARDYKGNAVHSTWVEVVDHKQICYQMCRNNPVWLEYLKKIMEIQIDAGVPGVQLDECELPITALSYGGCFCNDCKKQFRDYLIDLKAKGELAPEYMDIDLETFDYQAYLNERDIKFPSDSKGVPLFKEYWHFQIRAVKKYFGELVDHAKEYGLRTKGKDILVSGNFFNLMPVYYPIENKVDVLITEMRQTVFKQPYWYRYAAGFSGDKTITIVENPYGGIVPELVSMLEDGKGHDLYKIFLLEASAYGCNMSVPYGGWMGNTIKTSFEAPRRATEEVQTFLADNENLFAKKSGSNVLALYSFPSYYWRETVAGYAGNLIFDEEDGVLEYKVDDINNPDTPRLPFWEVVKYLSDTQVSYDIKVMPDGDLREDDFSLEDVSGYELILLPDNDILTEKQTEILEEAVKNGAKLLVYGRAAENVSGWLEKMKAMDGVIYLDNPDHKTEAIAKFAETFDNVYSDLWQVKTDNSEVGIQTHKTSTGMAVHLINYNYDKEVDKVEPIKELNVTVKCNCNSDCNSNKIKIHTIDGKEVEHKINVEDDLINISLYNFPVYAVIELKAECCGK